MGQERVCVAALLTGVALTMGGCGLADSRAVWPEALRVKASEPAPLEAPPDLKQRVSAPLHDPRGTGWTACVRAELTSVISKPLGTQTYRVFITDGMILDRRQV